MVSGIEKNLFPVPEPDQPVRNCTGLNIDQIEYLVGLIRKGNAVSLAKARQELGVASAELSSLIGVPENTLCSWETEKEIPPQKYLIAWRLKLGDFVDARISSFIGSTNEELITQFWEIMWRLNELTLRHGLST